MLIFLFRVQESVFNQQLVYSSCYEFIAGPQGGLAAHQIPFCTSPYQKSLPHYFFMFLFVFVGASEDQGCKGEQGR